MPRPTSTSLTFTAHFNRPVMYRGVPARNDRSVKSMSRTARRRCSVDASPRLLPEQQRRTNKRDKREHAKEAHPLRCSQSWIVLSAMERTLGLELEIRRPRFRDGRSGQPYAVSRLAGLIAK